MIITFIACINHKQRLFTVNIYNDSCLYKLKKNMQLGSLTSVRLSLRSVLSLNSFVRSRDILCIVNINCLNQFFVLACVLDYTLFRLTYWYNLLIERPVFDVWDIVTDDGAITIEYRYKVSEHSPQVYQEEWTKNREALNRTPFKYLGGQLYSNYFTIKSPTLDDKGTYSCTVTNAVGSASKDVKFGNNY